MHITTRLDSKRSRETPKNIRSEQHVLNQTGYMISMYKTYLEDSLKQYNVALLDNSGF